MITLATLRLEPETKPPEIFLLTFEAMESTGLAMVILALTNENEEKMALMEILEINQWNSLTSLHVN
jgi:hypothetical protein